jgi:CRP-like cAMP-binding protein
MDRPTIGDHADTLRQIGTTHRYPHDTVLFEQGSPADCVYLVEEGYVKVSRSEEDGAETVVGLRAAGWLLGEAAALLGEPYDASAVALTDCRVRQIQIREFRDRLRTSSDFSWHVHLLQSRETHEQAVRIASVGGLPTRRRLEDFLADVLASNGLLTHTAPQRLSPPLKHSDVAAIVVTTPEHLSRLLKKLEQEGLIRRDHGWLVAVRPSAFGSRRTTSRLRLDESQ